MSVLRLLQLAWSCRWPPAVECKRHIGYRICVTGLLLLEQPSTCQEQPSWVPPAVLFWLLMDSRWQPLCGARM
jgi:hypothetical protein